MTDHPDNDHWLESLKDRPLVAPRATLKRDIFGITSTARREPALWRWAIAAGVVITMSAVATPQSSIPDATRLGDVLFLKPKTLTPNSHLALRQDGGF